MTDRATTIAVAPDESLPDLLDRVRAAAGGEVRLHIPSGSAIFLTANEFRALHTVADGGRVRLTVDTDDPLRRQLAAMFGIPLAGEFPPAATPVSGRRPAGAARPGGPSAPRRPGPRRNLDAQSSRDLWASLPAADDGHASPTEAAARRRRITRLAALPRPRGRNLAISAAAALAILLLLGLAAFWLLPEATVGVYLKRQPVKAELLYAIAPADAPLVEGAALTVAARPTEVDVTFEGSVPATGIRLVPDARASGRVSLSNPTDEAVTIPAGTRFASDTGVEFEFAEEIRVPAAKGEGDDRRSGRAEAAVTAVEGGAVGNLETGALSGRLDSGVYFSNRNGPTTGGTDRSVTVVSEDDVAALRAQAEAAFPDLAMRTLARTLPPEQNIVPSSMTIAEPRFAFDRQPGDEASILSLTATARAAALTYDGPAARNDVKQAAIPLLTEAAPDGYELDPASLTLTDPVPAGDPSAPTLFRVTASAAAVAILPPAERDRIAAELAGGDEADAARILSAVPAIERYEIDYRPAWLPDRIPARADRIRIEPRT